MTIEEQVAELMKTVTAMAANQPTKEDFATMVSGAVKRLKSESIDPLAEQLKGLSGATESLSSLSELIKANVEEALNTALEGLDLGEETEADEGSGSGSDMKELIDAAIREAQQKSEAELKKLQQRLATAEKATEEERKLRESIAAQNRIQAMEAQAISALSGKVISGKEQRALSLLRQEGVLIEDAENNRFAIKGRNKYDEEVLLPLDDESFGALLSEQYSEFLPARPGTGTGAAPSPRQPVRISSPSDLAPLDDQSLVDIVSDDSKMTDLLKQLESAA